MCPRKQAQPCQEYQTNLVNDVPSRRKVASHDVQQVTACESSRKQIFAVEKAENLDLNLVTDPS